MGWKTKAIVVTRVEREAKELADAQEATRRDGIEVARESAGLKQVSLETAKNFIDSKINQATDLEELKTQVKLVLKKMVPYILN